MRIIGMEKITETPGTMPLMRAKTAEFTPIASARVRTAMSVNPGVLTS